MAFDRPREGDDPRAHWYGEHVVREDAIEAQRRKFAPAERPEQWRTRVYQKNGLPRNERPPAFSVDKARMVPDYQPGGRTRARMDVQDGPDVDLVSGNRGGEIMRRFKERHGGRLPSELGFVSFNYHHVEAQAAAYMRMAGRKEASLYVNNTPCKSLPDGCNRVLSQMLPPGARLSVFGPGGFLKIYRGKNDDGQGS